MNSSIGLATSAPLKTLTNEKLEFSPDVWTNQKLAFFLRRHHIKRMITYSILFSTNQIEYYYLKFKPVAMYFRFLLTIFFTAFLLQRLLGYHKFIIFVLMFQYVTIGFVEIVISIDTKFHRLRA